VTADASAASCKIGVGEFEQKITEESEGANKCQMLKQNGKDFWTGFTFAFFLLPSSFVASWLRGFV